jgi:hypothetical protein
MATLLIAVGTDADPTLEDPDEVAADIVESYNDIARANGGKGVSLLSAEWED